MEPPAKEAVRKVLEVLVERETVGAGIDWTKAAWHTWNAVAALKKTSSPGAPLMETYQTNADLIEGEGVEFLVAVVLERLRRLSQMDEELMRDDVDPMLLVRLGLCDPVRVMVKNELHTRLKINQGRMRLICCVSVIDQLVERVLTAQVQKKETAEWQWSLVKPGMGLHDVGLATLMQHFKGMKVPAGTDAKGWDWGVAYWLLMAFASLRSAQYGCGLRHTRTYTTMWERRAQCIASTVFVLSNGERYAQIMAMIMLSGSYWTSSGNSWMRVICAFLVSWVLGLARTDAAAMGDDCVEDILGCPTPQAETLTREYAKLGVAIKAVEFGNEFEFCSYRFDLLAETAAPAHPWKLAANFLYHWPTPTQMEERRRDLTYELRHSVDRDDIMNFLRHVEWLMLERTAQFARESPKMQPRQAW